MTCAHSEAQHYKNVSEKFEKGENEGHIKINAKVLKQF